MLLDVPSPIDLKRDADARQWAETAMSKRPWRIEFFQAFASAIHQHHPKRNLRILELGSGPGFLAQHLLTALPACDYVALDFSAAMHALAKERLAQNALNIEFVESSFLETTWAEGLGLFDVVVTLQAVHELRHKSRASTLHAQVRHLLSPSGLYLACDHYAGADGMSNAELYMTAEEQLHALHAAGYTKVAPILCKGGLVLHSATNS